MAARFNRDLRLEFDNPATTFWSLRRRSPSERSVAELCAGSFLCNRAYRHDSNLAQGRIHMLLTFTCRPSIPLRTSGLLTVQILLSLSAVRVLPSVPTLPERLVGFLDILLVSEPRSCAAPPFCPGPNHDRRTGQEGDHRNQHWLFHLLSSLGEETYMGTKGPLDSPVSRAS